MALMTAQEYVESLRKLNTRVYMFGEKIENWVDHPMIRPSINCVAMTYALAQDPQYADLMTVKSSRATPSTASPTCTSPRRTSLTR